MYYIALVNELYTKNAFRNKYFRVETNIKCKVITLDLYLEDRYEKK